MTPVISSSLANEAYPLVCLNTYEQPERYARCQQLFAQHELAVEFIRTHRQPDPVQGCYSAHQLAAQKYPQGVIVFEDDIVFEPTFNKRLLNELITWITNRNCHLLYLGCTPLIWNYATVHIKGPIYRVWAACTHAYIMGPNLAQKLAQTPYAGVPIDKWYYQNWITYAYLPILVDQGSFGSDIGTGILHQWLSNSALRSWIHALSSKYPQYNSWPLNYWLALLIILILLVGLLIICRR